MCEACSFSIPTAMSDPAPTSVTLTAGSPVLIYDPETNTAYRIVSFDTLAVGPSSGAQINVVRAPELLPLVRQRVRRAEALTEPSLSQEQRFEDELSGFAAGLEVYVQMVRNNPSAFPWGFWVLVLPGQPPLVSVHERREEAEARGRAHSAGMGFFVQQHLP